MGWVLIALRNAFHQLASGRSVVEGVSDTVMCGGDTDTNGAIAGALLGSAHGLVGIPAQWRRAVLTCRPTRRAGASQPRPSIYWSDDALDLAEALLTTDMDVGGVLGGNSEAHESVGAAYEGSAEADYDG